MITDKSSFSDIGVMIGSQGWKIYEKYMREVAQGALSMALNPNNDDKTRVRSLDKYNEIKKMIEDVYAEYKTNYDKYKGNI